MKSGKLAALGRGRVYGYHGSMSDHDAAGKSVTTWFVSRHPGAVEWAKAYGLAIDRWTGHLDAAQVASGDTVIGTLPVNLAAAVCDRGARYLHLSLEVPAQWRGKELTAEDLRVNCAKLKEFRIVEVS